jgi:hypothetical protein
MEIKWLVSKETWGKEGEESKKHFTPALLQFILTDLPALLDKTYGAGEYVVKVNDHKTYNLRGWRPADCTIGAKFSQHKKGNAVDFDVFYKGNMVPAKDIRELLINNHEAVPTLTRLEAGTNWVHGDCKETGVSNGIVIFKP